MNIFGILTGGFLSGYRSQVLGVLFALQALASYLVGDTSLIGLMEQLPEIIGGLGFAAFAQKVQNQGGDGGDG